MQQQQEQQQLHEEHRPASPAQTSTEAAEYGTSSGISTEHVAGQTVHQDAATAASTQGSCVAGPASGHDAVCIVNVEGGLASTSSYEAAECVVCWAAEAVVLFQPCGHMCTCQGCSGAFAASATSCPMCRTIVSNAIVLAL